MTSTDETTKPTNEQVKHAHAAAMAYVDRHVNGPTELVEAVLDAATDAVLWAWSRYQTDRGDLVPFAMSAVRRWVRRKNVKMWRRINSAPATVEIHENIPDRSHSAAGRFSLPMAVRELPADLRDAVRFFYIDKFDIRECGLLLGCGRETVRARLQRAAGLLASDRTVRRVQSAGDRRLLR